jgi:hypothetical protein
MANSLSSLITYRHPTYTSNYTDFDLWRLTYDGGEEYLNRYLKQFSSREDWADFEYRKSMTPIPNFAASAINDIRASTRASVSPLTLRQLCGNPDKGVTAWPIAEITRAVRPTTEQQFLLDELKATAAKAADAFKESCADSFAMTPPGRLRAMANRVGATLNAVRIVRPALEQFYNSLTDEQKARFNALGPNVGERSEQQPRREADAQAEGCGDPKSNLTQLPIDRIEAVLHPAGKQKEALERLSTATKNAVEGLQTACPDDLPLTPLGRLEAMQKRLEAMLHAAELVQPALDEFYATLSNEQKARFNTLSQVASR